MIYRFSCAAVIVFWLVMTALLVNRSYFSGEDRLPAVDPDKLIDLFVNNPNSSDLVVSRGAEQVGSITVAPRELPDGRIEVLVTALGKVDFPGLGEQDIAWRGELELTPEHEVAHFDLKLKFRNPRVTVSLEIDPQTYAIEYQVMQDGSVLVDSDDKTSKAVKRVEALLGLWGMSPKALARKDARRKAQPANASGQQMVARYGKVQVGSERLTAYLLDLSPTKGKGLKLYFSEAGELLKVSPVMGYEILSDSFAKPNQAGGKK